MSEHTSTHALSYARNPTSGKVHIVTVSRGRIALSDEQCNVDDMTEPLELIGDGEAWAAFRKRPASWCDHCLEAPPPDDVEGAPA